MVSFISMFTLVHPFATTWHFPSRGNEKFRGAFLLPPHRTAGKGGNASCQRGSRRNDRRRHDSPPIVPLQAGGTEAWKKGPPKRSPMTDNG